MSSEFWLENSDIFDDLDQLQLIKLASARRAISNFVRILTNKSIPVLFNETKDSQTDGTKIYISANLKTKEDFDYNVGLALHEASHVLLTDFKLLNWVGMDFSRELYNMAEERGIDKITLINFRKYIWNYVEDRFCDAFVYRTAPGYRDYYIKLYTDAFLSPAIDEMLKSQMYREPSFNAYKYRIVNIFNINTDLTALPELDTIYKLLDLNNIGNLVNGKDRHMLAYKITEIILKNVYETKHDVAEAVDSDILGGIKISANEDDEKSNNPYIENKGNTSGLDDQQLDKIEKALHNQDDFINGTLKKKKISLKNRCILDAIDKSNIEVVNVGQDYVDNDGNASKGIECIVVNNLTKDLILSQDFPLYSDIVSSGQKLEVAAAINRGVVLGKKLAKRLQLINYINVTKLIRKARGKLDRHILHEVAIDNENIFYTTTTDTYTDNYIHLTVDASGSMYGKKWHETIACITAICKAVEFISNMHITVSFRTTIQVKNSSNTESNCIPYIVFAYDSKKDKFSKITTLFPYLTPNGATPEGLTFQSILEKLPKTRGNNLYFINLSDGMPYYNFNTKDIKIDYRSKAAAIHTKKQIDTIKSYGYEIISYFIEEKSSKRLRSNAIASKLFKIMYGENAEFIGVFDVVSISKSLNRKFLKI